MPHENNSKASRVSKIGKSKGKKECSAKARRRGHLVPMQEISCGSSLSSKINDDRERISGGKGTHK